MLPYAGGHAEGAGYCRCYGNDDAQDDFPSVVFFVLFHVCVFSDNLPLVKGGKGDVPLVMYNTGKKALQA